MGRESAAKALLDAGITYDKVQQVRISFCIFFSHLLWLCFPGSHIYSPVPRPTFLSFFLFIRSKG